MFQVLILDLNVLKLLSHNPLLDLNVHTWRSHRILWTSMSTIELKKFLAGGRGTARRGGAARGETAAVTSQQLWNLGGALVQRAQEPNIPFGESLTSTNRPPKGDRSEGFYMKMAMFNNFRKLSIFHY